MHAFAWFLAQVAVLVGSVADARVVVVPS